MQPIGHIAGHGPRRAGDAAPSSPAATVTFLPRNGLRRRRNSSTGGLEGGRTSDSSPAPAFADRAAVRAWLRPSALGQDPGPSDLGAEKGSTAANGRPPRWRDPHEARRKPGWPARRATCTGGNKWDCARTLGRRPIMRLESAAPDHASTWERSRAGQGAAAVPACRQAHHQELRIGRVHSARRLGAHAAGRARELGLLQRRRERAAARLQARRHRRAQRREHRRRRSAVSRRLSHRHAPAGALARDRRLGARALAAAGQLPRHRHRLAHVRQLRAWVSRPNCPMPIARTPSRASCCTWRSWPRPTKARCSPSRASTARRRCWTKSSAGTATSA